MKVRDEMTPLPYHVAPDCSLEQALRLMERHRIRHLLVQEDGEVVGVISERDLHRSMHLSTTMQIRVKDVMSEKPYMISTDESLADVARVMSQKKYGCAVITDEFNRPVGIFTTTDGMRVLSDLLDGDEGLRLRFKKMTMSDYFDQEPCDLSS